MTTQQASQQATDVITLSNAVEYGRRKQRESASPTDDYWAERLEKAARYFVDRELPDQEKPT